MENLNMWFFNFSTSPVFPKAPNAYTGVKPPKDAKFWQIMNDPIAI
jgi:hypothetical protein